MSTSCIFKPFVQQRCSLSYIGWLSFYSHVELHYFTKMGRFWYIKLVQFRHLLSKYQYKGRKLSGHMYMCYGIHFAYISMIILFSDYFAMNKINYFFVQLIWF